MSSQQGHNPLRPYYIPPPTFPPITSNIPAPPIPSASYSYPPTPADAKGPGILTEYSEYLEGNSPKEVIRGWFTKVGIQYSLQLIAQPFENSRTLLQCRVVPKGVKKLPWAEGEVDDDDDAASDDSDPPYFTDNLDDDGLPRVRGSAKKLTDRAGYVLDDDPKDPDMRQSWMLETVPGRVSTIGEMIRALWAREGYSGIWKAQNSTIVYSILVATLESWTSSFLSAILSLPDPGVGEIADSAYPLASLGVAVAACTITAVVLSPIDVVRTKLVVTPTSDGPRNLLPSLRALPSYLCPPNLLLPTTLHSSVPSFISLGTPYFLRTRLNIDPINNPTTFSLTTFLSSTAELIVRLPLETVLRRAQVAVAKPRRTVVPVGRYAGVFGTMWCVAREEDGGKYGVEGLYRGWRMGLWANVGVLGLELFGVKSAEQAEF